MQCPSSESTVPTLLRLLCSLLLRLCVSACCTRQAVPLHACRGAPQLLFRCIEDAVGQLQLPLWLLSIHLRINCHCHFSSLQLARSLRPPAPNQCFLEPGTSWSCCINLYVLTTPLSARLARWPANQQSLQGGQPKSQHTLLPLNAKNMTGLLFESKNHLSQHNIGFEPSKTQ